MEPNAARELLDAVIAAFAVLGGTMAYSSGLGAAQAQAAQEPAGVVAQRINDVAEGFRAGVPLALTALIIVVWS